MGKILKWTSLILVLGLILLVTTNCTMLGLNHASLSTADKPAPPALSAGIIARDPAARAALRTQFEDALYGPWPEGLAPRAVSRKVIDAAYHDGRATLEEVTVEVGSGEGARQFHLVVVLPSGPGPHPVIISQTFSSNCAVFPDDPVTSPDGSLCDGSSMSGPLGFVATQIFGTYIALAPTEWYIDAGIGYASFYASQLVPDRKALAPDIMANLGADTAPTSALMAWAGGFSAAVEVLEADPRIDPQRTGVLGHSRHGKSALLAGAWDDRIDLVIAHQSGFAGSSLSASQTGERLDRMAKTYPHWVRPGLYSDLSDGEELPVDQHQLIALLAPTPVLLGNGRRDVWSDPNSSYRAVRAAAPAYGEDELPERVPYDGRDLSPGWWLRSGGHSVVEEDIRAFIDFADQKWHLTSGKQEGGKQTPVQVAN